MYFVTLFDKTEMYPNPWRDRIGGLEISWFSKKKRKPLRKQNLGMDIHILCRHIDNHMFIRMIVDSLTILSYCLYLN